MRLDWSYSKKIQTLLQSFGNLFPIPPDTFSHVYEIHYTLTTDMKRQNLFIGTSLSSSHWLLIIHIARSIGYGINSDDATTVSLYVNSTV